MDDIADEDGWAHLAALGTNITKLRPEFDPRTHGYKKLSDLIKGYPKHLSRRPEVHQVAQR